MVKVHKEAGSIEEKVMRICIHCSQLRDEQPKPAVMKRIAALEYTATSEEMAYVKEIRQRLMTETVLGIAKSIHKGIERITKEKRYFPDHLEDREQSAMDRAAFRTEEAAKKAANAVIGQDFQAATAVDKREASAPKPVEGKKKGKAINLIRLAEKLEAQARHEGA